MSENEYSKNDISSETGTVLFPNKEEFAAALQYVQSKFSWITEEWIEETLKHEDEHLDEAKKRFGEKGRYQYELQAITMNNGNLGMAGGFRVDVCDMSQEEMNEKHRHAILDAPEKKSALDKRGALIDLNSDISNENGWD